MAQVDTGNATALRLIVQVIISKILVLIIFNDLIDNIQHLLAGRRILGGFTTGSFAALNDTACLNPAFLGNDVQGLMQIVCVILPLKYLATHIILGVHITAEGRLTVNDQVTTGDPGHHSVCGRQVADLLGEGTLRGGCS